VEEGSQRRQELLERAYLYVLGDGLDVSLRPLAAAVGSSPRVLLYLFGSKDGLVQALLARARRDQTELLAAVLAEATAAEPSDLAACVARLWRWLADPCHRDLLRLWVEGYSRSLVGDPGPWAGFAEQTVRDWLELLGRLPGPGGRPVDATTATLLLAVLRGALLDLVATGDTERTTAAVMGFLRNGGSV